MKLGEYVGGNDLMKRIELFHTEFLKSMINFLENFFYCTRSINLCDWKKN